MAAGDADESAAAVVHPDHPAPRCAFGVLPSSLGGVAAARDPHHPLAVAPIWITPRATATSVAVGIGRPAARGLRRRPLMLLPPLDDDASCAIRAAREGGWSLVVAPGRDATGAAAGDPHALAGLATDEAGEPRPSEAAAAVAAASDNGTRLPRDGRVRPRCGGVAVDADLRRRASSTAAA